MADILDGLHQMRVAFKQAGLEPPSVVLLDSSQQGHKFLMEMRQCDKMIMVAAHALEPRKEDLPEGVQVHRAGTFETVVEHPDGSAWMEVDLMGIKVRWPADRIAETSGKGFRFG